MAKQGPSYAELVHQIVRESPEPVAPAAILERVAAIMPIANKNPIKTIRNALRSSHIIVSVGDGRYGWKPRLADGALMRHTLSEDDLKGPLICIGDELRDLFWPAALGSSKHIEDRQPLLHLPNGLAIELSRATGPSWSVAGFDTFLTWLCAKGALPGDCLLVRCIDGDGGRYEVVFEPRSARDEQAIAARNQQVLAAAVAFLHKRRGRAPIWDTTTHLIAMGFYRDPVAPDPLRAIWTEEVWGPVAERYGETGGLVGGWGYIEGMSGGVFPGLSSAIGLPAIGSLPVPPPGLALAEAEQRINALLAGGFPPRLDPNNPIDQWLAGVLDALGSNMQAGARLNMTEARALADGDEDWIDEGIALGLIDLSDLDVLELNSSAGDEPADLPAAYKPGGARRPIPSALGKRGPVTTYVLRVNHQARPDVWREIEIAEDQNLEDLHLAIQDAFRWHDEHLYSFFMSGRAYDSRSEIGSPWSDTERRTYKVTIGELKLKLQKRFLYLYDYGDDHRFDIRVVRITKEAPKGKYPKVIARAGRSFSPYEEEV